MNVPLMRRPIRLLLIAGHGGSSPGAAYQNRQEYVYTQDLVTLIQQELKRRNSAIDLILEPCPMNVVQEMEYLRNVRPDMALSIHFNSGGASGSEMIVPFWQANLTVPFRIIDLFRRASFPIREMAIYSRSAEARYPRTNGVPLKGRDYYGIIREGSSLIIPSYILEVAFLDNPNNMQFYERNRLVYAQLIAQALDEFAGRLG